jgi:hypothetical protein
MRIYGYSSKNLIIFSTSAGFFAGTFAAATARKSPKNISLPVFPSLHFKTSAVAASPADGLFYSQKSK